jgi:hypothetical protein
VIRRNTMAQIARLYTTLPAPAPSVADYSFDPVAPFPVVKMEVEASKGEEGNAALYAVRIIVRDVLGGVVAAAPNQTGSVTDANWPVRNATFTFTLPAAITGAAAAGKLVEVFGILRVGAVLGGSNIDVANAQFVWAF